MNITVLFMGKTAFPFIKEGCSIYEKRLVHYTGFTKKEIPDVKNPSSLSKEQLKAKEADLILSNVMPGDFLVVLDENGKELTSVGFASELEKRASAGAKNVIFVIGGAYGFDKRVYDRANATISLSRMTFSHQMVRLILLEQIYRAFTIIKGEPYHHQ